MSAATTTTVDDQFLADLLQEVRELAEHEDLMLPSAFAQWVMETLEEAGEFEEPELSPYAGRGLEVTGFAFSEDNSAVDLIIASYETRSTPSTEPKAAATGAVKRAAAFLQKALGGLHEQMEESSAAFDLALELHALKDDIKTCRIVFITDGLVKSAVPAPPAVDGIAIAVDVWDIERIYRLESSGRRQEAIRVDIEEQFGNVWSCLPATKSDDTGYSVYLALIPGRQLAEIYDHYGPRLLELNVRSFLQARGKVNKGIRDTILKEPGRFLAYNNGITATAGKVRLVQGPDGGSAIAEIEDLQIVNGGQTTASLHRALVADSAELDGVMVQAKVTVADGPAQLKELVPLISRFSNSQNKVSEADFAANDPFHVQLETISRSMWAPAVDGGTRQTRWFYERARGQYQDAIGREGTTARRRQFRQTHPTAQKFTKTDVAKFEYTWSGLPNVVSLGAQKTFLRYQSELNKRPDFVPDERWFTQLVAKAVMFRAAEKIVSAQKLGGYRANVVTYSLALINHWTENRINLEQIWKLQAIPKELEDQIGATAREVFAQITNPPAGVRNISEWAKKEDCWKAIRSMQRPTDSPLYGILAKTRQDTLLATTQSTTIAKESAVVDKMRTVGAEALFALEVWGMSTRNLDGRERKIVQNVAVALSDGSSMGRRQAGEADKIIQKSLHLGFTHEQLGLYS